MFPGKIQAFTTTERVVYI